MSGNRDRIRMLEGNKDASALVRLTIDGQVLGA